jgi:hypothetical protein
VGDGILHFGRNPGCRVLDLYQSRAGCGSTTASARRDDSLTDQIVINREDIEFAVDNSDVRLYENYTYDSEIRNTTFGVIGSTVGLLKFFVNLTMHDPDLAFRLAGAVAHDNFGHDRIYFFPGFDLVEKDRDREEIDDDDEGLLIDRPID